jgi:hypothetical protein
MDLTRKAHFVAGGHTTETPLSLTYSGVVSRDSVWIASFLMVALNDVNVLSCDISNAYLNTCCQAKIWFVAGPEFGSRQGQVVKIVRAFYGLKSSGASWRSVLKQTIIKDLQFEPTIADPNAYQRRAVHPRGFEYCELLQVYVNDILVVSHDPQSHLEKLKQQFHMSAIGRPYHYLGANIKRVYIFQETKVGKNIGQSRHSHVFNMQSTTFGRCYNRRDTI